MQHHQQHHHRNPGNGYRSGPPSRVSVEHRYLDLGGPRTGALFSVQQIPLRPLPPGKAEIFMEAGRLAAEYLFSQGSQPAFHSKWQNRRFPVRPNSDPSEGGGTRTSALARLGGPVAAPNSDGDSDVDARRRRFGDDEFTSPPRSSAFRAQNLKPGGSRRRPAAAAASSSSSSAYRGYDSTSDYQYSRPASFHDRLSRDSTLVSEQQQLGNDKAEPEFESPQRESSEEPLKTADDRATSVGVDETAEKRDVNQKGSSEGGSSGDHPDLRSSLTMCMFAKVPTRARSSKTPKIPKPDPAPPLSEPEKKDCAQDGLGLNPESSQGACSSASANEKGNKRALGDECDLQEGPKRPRGWPSSSGVVDEVAYFDTRGLSEKKVNSRDDGGEAQVKISQEQQPFPGSFKICDLNLMEVSEAHENRHEDDPMAIYPPLSELKREAASPLDIDLSVNNSKASGETSRLPFISQEIEVIDLENDSSPEDKDPIISDKKTETVYSELESFPIHTQNTADIPDVQDGYGLMISELLENDFPNCSSVPEQINPINNDIGLHNREGALGDDDSIYMSLGEIPLTFLRPWEQPPPQEYEKPF